MKIGDVELCEWFYPYINGVHWPTPYRIEKGTIFDGSHYFSSPFPYVERTAISINCGGPGNFWPEFLGRLAFLKQYYRPQDFVSYEEAKQYTDKFLEQMSRLIAFI
jgi:hypothetical protein